MSRPSTTDAAMEEALARAARTWSEELGIPQPELRGKMLRPRLAWAAASLELRCSPELAAGMLAIQMVHEASLLHDDILDDSDTRRGVPSVVARQGLAAALVGGDHLLSAAYRVALASGSAAFMGYFTRAVERTVAGEKAQGRAVGRILRRGEYEEIVSAKSGELFGAALCLPASLEESRSASPAAARRARQAFDLGIRIGCLYQMVDDFLDLCPNAGLGKAPRQDYRQRKWTWPLEYAGLEDFGLSDAELTRRLFHRRGTHGSPMRRALEAFAREASTLQTTWEAVHPGDREAPGLLEEWHTLLTSTLEREEAVVAAQGQVEVTARALGDPADWGGHFAHHSRSFHFSARLFPPEEGRIVSGVYTFCRFTDDLVDRAPALPAPVLGARLDAWRRLIERAHAGDRTGVPLLDQVMGESRRRDVPAGYALALVDGVAMDLEPREFPDLESLREYSFKVASVVGMWLTELFGVRDPWVLERGESLGHAMQLTNILRDVGEDLRRGRLYLPLGQMRSHGVTRRGLEAVMSNGEPLPEGYSDLLEELMSIAEGEYDRAIAGLPALPPFFQRPVAVAARVYRGIHQEIRRNEYDNLRRRAMTSLSRKLLLGGRGLWELRSARRDFDEVTA